MRLVVSARPMIARRLSGFAISVLLHAAALSLVVTLPWPPRRNSERRTSEPVVTFVAAPDDRGDAGDRELVEPVPSAGTGSSNAGRLQVTGFDFEIGKIRARRNALFAFLTTNLRFLDRVEAAIRANHGKLVNPFVATSRKTSKPPLAISNGRLQEIVDRSWSRRDRWLRARARITSQIG